MFASRMRITSPIEKSVIVPIQPLVELAERVIAGAARQEAWVPPSPKIQPLPSPPSMMSLPFQPNKVSLPARP